VLRSAWWEDDIQVETLAAVAALVSGYDTDAWVTAKLQLLHDLDRIREPFRVGENVSDAKRDRESFVQHLLGLAARRTNEHRRRLERALLIRRLCGSEGGRRRS
jgi:hypothetical protein